MLCSSVAVLWDLLNQHYLQRHMQQMTTLIVTSNVLKVLSFPLSCLSKMHILTPYKEHSSLMYFLSEPPKKTHYT